MLPLTRPCTSVSQSCILCHVVRYHTMKSRVSYITSCDNRIILPYMHMTTRYAHSHLPGNWPLDFLCHGGLWLGDPRQFRRAFRGLLGSIPAAHIYIYIYVYTYMYTYYVCMYLMYAIIYVIIIHLYTLSLSLSLSICLSISLSISLSLYIYIYICLYVCMYVCMYVYVHIYIHICIYIYIYIYTYIYIYIYIDRYVSPTTLGREHSSFGHHGSPSYVPICGQCVLIFG